MHISQKKRARRIVKSLGYETSEMTDSEVETAIRDKYVLLVSYDCQQRQSIFLLPREIESELISLDGDIGGEMLS